jgi:hypothetical protein
MYIVRPAWLSSPWVIKDFFKRAVRAVGIKWYRGYVECINAQSSQVSEVRWCNDPVSFKTVLLEKCLLRIYRLSLTGRLHV